MSRKLIQTNNMTSEIARRADCELNDTKIKLRSLLWIEIYPLEIESPQGKGVKIKQSARRVISDDIVPVSIDSRDI